MNTNTDFHDAALELAEANARLYMSTSIVLADAMPYVNVTTACEWIADTCGLSSPQEVISDLAHTLTDADAYEFLHALTNQSLPHEFAKVVDALYQAVGRDLVYAAEKAQANLEPTDDESSRDWPITRNDIDDPFLAERRSFTRAHNASIAGWRRV